RTDDALVSGARRPGSNARCQYDRHRRTRLVREPRRVERPRNRFGSPAGPEVSVARPGPIRRAATIRGPRQPTASGKLRPMTPELAIANNHSWYSSIFRAHGLASRLEEH